MTLKVETSSFADPATRPFEIVERKGIGHPDTLCDAIAEGLSAALSRFYLDRFGVILHHNVDKVLLRGGAARPRFGGGEVIEPIEIFLAGRATRHYKGVDVPVDELAVETSRAILRKIFHTLDPDRHVNIHCLVRPGSEDLVDLFLRQQRTGVWLANDSSIGVGFAPMSPLERSVLAIDQVLTSPTTRKSHPAFGEDIKLLAFRRGDETSVTVACAFCDRHVGDLGSYLAQKAELAALVAESADDGTAVTVNAADDAENGSVYLTVTGTSAEAGDDGQTGRGNRANGLITPGRPMTMESIAGKNPVSHVGKIYNLAARTIAKAVVREVPDAAAAECYLVSQIGAPVAEPRLAHVRIATRDGRPVAELHRAIELIMRERLAGLDTIWRSILDASTTTF